MNQIIYSKKNDEVLVDYKDNVKNKIRIYKSLFIFSLTTLLIFFVYYAFLYLQLLLQEDISQDILGVYDIQQLYATNINSIVPYIMLESGEKNNILGIIEIDKINLRYPILEKTTDSFLAIAPCKFYGNNINEYGNFCIAGHNYDNGQFFSNLKLLDYGDIIRLYDLTRKFYFLYCL